MEILGIDIGGSGIKGAPVDVATGELTAKRLRLKTPTPATPDPVAATVAELVRRFGWNGPIGCAFPGVVREGVVFWGGNIAPSWFGTNAQTSFTAATGCPVTVINDADAAGLAEMTWGSGAGRLGLVLMLTFGTGIGSGMFVDGKLVPNTELGQVLLHGGPAEHWAAADVRKREHLSIAEWAGRVAGYLAHLDAVLSPDVFIFGGGISKRFEEFGHLLQGRVPVLPAMLRNDAGLVGAALRSYEVLTAS